MTLERLPMTTKIDPDDYPDGSVAPDTGWHVLAITGAAVGPNKKRTCNMLTLRVQVITGDATGFSLRDWTPYVNMKFGFGKLTAMLRALGIDHQEEGGTLDAYDRDSVHSNLLGKMLRGRVVNKGKETRKDNKTGKDVEFDAVEMDREKTCWAPLSSDERSALLAQYPHGYPLPDDAKVFGYWQDQPKAAPAEETLSDDEIPF